MSTGETKYRKQRADKGMSRGSRASASSSAAAAVPSSLSTYAKRINFPNRIPSYNPQRFINNIRYSMRQRKMNNYNNMKYNSKNNYSNYVKAFGININDKYACLNYFSAILEKNLNDSIAITSNLGNYVTTNFKTYQTITTNAPVNGDKFLIFQSTPGGVVAVSYQYNISGGSAYSPVIYSDFLANVPVVQRASRHTIQIMNTTLSNNVESSIDYVMLNGTQLQWGVSGNVLSQTFTDQVNSIVNVNQKTRTISAKDLTSSKVFHLLPMSMVNCSKWFSNSAISSSIDYTGINAALSNVDQTHTTLIIRFNTTSQTNTYKCIFNSQYSCRYTANTILENLSKPANKTVPPQQADIIVAAAGIHQDRGKGDPNIVDS